MRLSIFFQLRTGEGCRALPRPRLRPVELRQDVRTKKRVYRHSNQDAAAFSAISAVPVPNMPPCAPDPGRVSRLWHIGAGASLLPAAQHALVVSL